MLALPAPRRRLPLAALGIESGRGRFYRNLRLVGANRGGRRRIRITSRLLPVRANRRGDELLTANRTGQLRATKLRSRFGSLLLVSAQEPAERAWAARDVRCATRRSAERR